MKKALVLGLAILFAMGAAAYADEKPVKEWTFMCFLNADNNLDPYGVQDMDEMKKIGSTDQVNVVVLVDREHGPAKMLYIEKGKEVLIKEMGELDMGDYKQLVSFVKFCKENYPAKKYALDIWNHGAGWKLKADEKVFRGISYDDSTGNGISTVQLKTACNEIMKVLGQKLDIMSHDACLMGMLEINAEQHEGCKYFVASEETEPGDGYCYDLFLAPLVKKPTMDAKEFAVAMVRGFAQYYANERGTTTSAVDQAKIPALIAKTEALAVAMAAGLTTPENKTAMKSVMTAVQKFYYRDNIDLYHLCTLLEQKINDAGIKAAAGAVKAAVKAAVVDNFNSGGSHANANGIAIYLPTYSMSSAYTAISLGKTKWVNGIKAVNACYKTADSKTLPIEADLFAYNLDYPTIAAEGLALEARNGQFENFDQLLALDTEAATAVKSELKKKLGADVLNGNEALKHKVELLLEK